MSGWAVIALLVIAWAVVTELIIRADAKASRAHDTWMHWPGHVWNMWRAERACADGTDHHWSADDPDTWHCTQCPARVTY